MLKQVADKIDSDLFSPLSSLHEVIAIPVNTGKEAAELKEMAVDVNQKQLQSEEVLSDNLYIPEGAG